MDHRSDGRREQLLDAAKGHGSFRERSLDARHFASRTATNLTGLERNAEWILDVRILPGVLKSLEPNHFNIVALGNADALAMARLRLRRQRFPPRQAIGRGEPHDLARGANSNANRFDSASMRPGRFLWRDAVANVMSAHRRKLRAHARCF